MITEERAKSFLDDVAECWENMGLHLGTKLLQTDDGWELTIHPLPVEVDGKKVESADDTIDLLDVLALFDEKSVEFCSIHNAEITVAGKVDGTDVTLFLWLYVPEGEEVVDRIVGNEVRIGQ